MMGRNDVGGASSCDFKHWVQLYWTKEFQSRDFSGSKAVNYPVENYMTYFKDTPIMNFVGSVDAFAQEADYERLHALLPNVTAVKIPDYNHLDYMWSDDCDSLVNKQLLPFIRENANI